MANKKDLAAFASGTLATLELLAKKLNDPSINAEVEKLKKQKDEVLSEHKSIGPCFGCKEVQTVKAKEYDFKKAQWFICPHNDMFCPDCLKKGREEAKKAREAAREARKKEGGKSKGKK